MNAAAWTGMTPAQRAPIIRRGARECSQRDWAFTYAIQAGEDGPIKIGRSDNPAQRLRTLQTAHHDELRGLAAWPEWQSTEADLHALFAHLRVRGEWFRAEPELVDLVVGLGGIFCDWEPER